MVADPNNVKARRRVGRALFQLVAPVQRFLRTEAAGGALLMGAALIAMLWANSPWAHAYHHLVETPVGLRVGAHDVVWPLQHAINDLLMTLFFLVAGMEIRRELSAGELRTPARAALPLLAALGGMLAPAGLYLLVAGRGAGASGWGIPMATDIAFSLGVIGFVKRRVPPSLMVFLTALAIFDDLGAIVVIALFYGGRVSVPWLLAAGALTASLVAISRAQVRALTPYAVFGTALWVALARAGLHPTLAGVTVGLCLSPRPARAPDEVLAELDGALDQLRAGSHAERDALAALERHLESMQSPLDRAMHNLHGAVAFVIVPLFAFANAGVTLTAASLRLDPVPLGVALGLVVGKPVGVTLATWIGVRSGLAPMPGGARWRDVLGVAMLAGIGFTMSLFVDELAFRGDAVHIDLAKLGVLAGSLLSALAGIAWIRAVGRDHAPPDDERDVTVHASAARFADGFAVRTWAWPPALDGRSLLDARVRERTGVTVLGRALAGRANVALVGPHESLLAGTELIVVGAVEDLDAMDTRVTG